MPCSGPSHQYKNPHPESEDAFVNKVKWVDCRINTPSNWIMSTKSATAYLTLVKVGMDSVSVQHLTWNPPTTKKKGGWVGLDGSPLPNQESVLYWADNKFNLPIELEYSCWKSELENF